MHFEKLVTIYEELENTASGNKMREILSEFFKEVPSENLKIITYLTLGQISSDYESVVLGIAEKTILKSISLAGGVDSSKVRQILKETGDAGLTAEKIMKNKPMTLVPLGKLTIDEFFHGLHKVAEAEGNKSIDVKVNLIARLLQKTSPKGAKYLIRIALGTLRMGVGEMTVLDSLAIAFTGEKKNKKILEHAFNICPDVGIIAETMAQQGLAGIQKIDIHVGRPIKMMLCQRVKNIEEIQEKIPGPIEVEEKYDGERIQVHKSQGKITLFSRRLENITEQYPDVINYLENQVQAKEYVIEGEVVAIDEKNRVLPFQVLMQRRRKYDIEEYVKKIPVCFFLFEILYLDGKSYLQKTHPQRMAALKKITSTGKHLTIAGKIVTENIKEVDKFFRNSLKEGYEGIIAKSMAKDSFYQPGNRGWLWIKWKKDYVTELVDNFDLVIIGAFFGKGKRCGNYGALLCATYNNREDTFESVTKLGTGFTDEVLEELPKMLAKYQVSQKPARVKVQKEMSPDVWFEPKLILEVQGAEITRGQAHVCAEEEGKGLAIRFPRFICFRKDKKAEQATTSEEVEEIYKK